MNPRSGQQSRNWLHPDGDQLVSWEGPGWPDGRLPRLRVEALSHMRQIRAAPVTAMLTRACVSYLGKEDSLKALKAWLNVNLSSGSEESC